MLRNFKVILAVLVVLVLAGAAYAFAATNTVDNPGNVGYKESNPISGYTIGTVTYDLVDSDPTLLKGISFPITPTDATTVKINVAAGTTKNFDASKCVNTLGSVTCTFINTEATPIPIEVLSVGQLDIVASSSLNPAP
jgi:hypothetical protein